MTKLRSYRDLHVWMKSMQLVEKVYLETKNFPADEKYTLTSQIRRSAISIPSNIAEGQGRNTDGEFLQFLGIASGSLSELETQIELSVRLGYMPNDTALNLMCDEVGKMLTGLIKSIKK
ncbi:MAG: four helix bundle protein [Saprospiraceae bacterium]|nr:four helix bundle protein [Saprospiraceae bacterium]